MSEIKNSLLSEKARHAIDKWLEKFPADRKQSGSLYALRVVQEENGGWLSNELIEAVADYLQLPKISVYEVATFYSMYDLKPVGRHKVAVCNSISCMLRGSNDLLKHLEKRLGVAVDETTADGKFTLKTAECLAACGAAPVMQIDAEDYYENMTAEKADALLERLAKENANG